MRSSGKPMVRVICPECGETFSQAGFCTSDGAALVDAGDDDLLGAIIGSHRVTRLLGEGGMGRVYAAVHPVIKSRVAIKVLSHERAQNTALLDRFFAEARTVNLIRHEHIVNVLDFARLPDSRPFIQMEYLEGRSLADLVHERGRLPLGWLALLAGEVLSALAAAHARGIIHRDLKPDNVFVTPAGHAKILDFGIAKLLEPSGLSAPATRAGAAIGTPHYMPPEQIEGRAVDARSDLYSLGVLLYECATGKKPFEADELYQILRLHLTAEPELPSRYVSLPPAYEQCLLRALKKPPELRFQSADEMRAMLELAASSLPAESRQPPLIGSRPLSFGKPSHPMLGPTTAGSTFSAAISATPALPMPVSSPPRTASAWPWIALIAIAFALGAIVIVGGIFGVIALRSNSSGPAAGTASGDGNAPIIVVSKPSTRSKKQPHAPIDVTGMLPDATRRAKGVASDAALVKITSFGVDNQGTVDFTRKLSPWEPLVKYRFVSISRRQKWMNEPGITDKKTECVIEITFRPDGEFAGFTNSDCDDEIPTHAPRCSFAQAYAKSAQASGHTDAPWADQLRFEMLDGEVGWFSEFGKKQARIPDECGK